jgi:hypothetical protein
LLKTQIDTTDKKIDQMVYKLNGLNEGRDLDNKK